MTGKQTLWRRGIPSMERILASDAVTPLIATYGRDEVKLVASRLLDELRAAENERDLAIDSLSATLSDYLSSRTSPSLRRVINATGVLVHTNLGRSPVSRAAWTAASELVSSYSNLEFDLGEGTRGKRDSHIDSVAARLFGCESALLVNNNAAAVLLLLSAVAGGREVLVSRGELVEIGGGFRVPDIIQQGGAKLVEVGTTNRTRARDYEAAISDRTAAVLLVHRSNFDIVGFTETPEVGELVEICRRRNVPLLYDEGTGRVTDLSPYGLSKKATVAELIRDGVDVVTCSTDKLIGTVQGGLILGRRELLAKCAKHPLMRALRAGKESYALVGATLESFVSHRYETELPLYSMLAASIDELRRRATVIAGAVGASVVESRAAIGGGTTPNETIASCGVRLTGDAERWRESLLAAKVPIVGTIVNDAFTLDLRSVDPEDDTLVIETLKALRR